MVQTYKRVDESSIKELQKAFYYYTIIVFLMGFTICFMFIGMKTLPIYGQIFTIIAFFLELLIFYLVAGALEKRIKR